MFTRLRSLLLTGAVAWISRTAGLVEFIAWKVLALGAFLIDCCMNSSRQAQSIHTDRVDSQLSLAHDRTSNGNPMVSGGAGELEVY